MCVRERGGGEVEVDVQQHCDSPCRDGMGGGAIT